jgi:hypothetical protein
MVQGRFGETRDSSIYKTLGHFMEVVLSLNNTSSPNESLVCGCPLFS